MNRRNTDVGVFELMPQSFGKTTDGEFRRSVSRLFGRRDKTENARNINDVRFFLLF